ncbi:hypothetical protein ACIBCN_05325 [Nocardia sp. NPDC051052]|uniref:hypothetical protein n=1 Tax=Nocardia sp. NPDC051052 TaxID=3364322 RepID=UPI0037A06B8D
MADFVSGVGPLFGPDFVVVTVNDETGKRYDVQVYPDAHNPELRQAGQPTQYYFQPSRVYLARKHDTPDEYDFQMTLFKGLLDEESSVTPEELRDAVTEIGGGFCTFSTTFAIPDSVIEGVLQKLKQHEHGMPGPRLAQYFNFQANDPAPVLGIVPITDSAVVCAVPDPAAVGHLLNMTAQYSGKGSIEQHGISTFLISCNLVAAGAIASALKAGTSPPFTVANTLQEAFYINGVTVVVNIDVDKVYDSFSAAVSSGSFFGITDLEAEYAYSSCVTSGGVTTHITQNGAILDEQTKKWVTENVDMMKKTAMDLVKQEIFDWDPSKTDSKAAANRGWFSQVFGGTSVSLKSTHERRAIHFNQTLILDETIAVSQTVSGDLNDLLPAVRADLNKYLFIIDIGEFFKKIQVAAACQVDFNAPSELRDPLRAVQLEVGYPDYSRPVEDGQPNLRMLGQGQHYIPGQLAPSGPVRPAIWTDANEADYVNVSFLRLDNPVPGWPTDQVKLRRKLVFDGRDPRVSLSSAMAPHDPAIAEIEELTTSHSQILTAAAVGYIFVRFYLHPAKLPPNITVSITPTIGADTYPPISVHQGNQTDALWEVFTDKYDAESEFSYTMKVVVDGVDFLDETIIYSTATPVKVPLPLGRIKYVPLLDAPLPAAPPDKVATIRDYVNRAVASA